MRATLTRATAVLRAAGINNPRLEARLLLGHALGLSQTELLAAGDAVVPADFDVVLARRVAREPLAFILGRQEFWSLNFAASPATLIPRADSETLISAALAAFADRDSVRHVLDLGTGTGCLLLAALTEFPAAFGVGVDIAPEAAALAAGNAAQLGLAGRAAFLAGDWASALGTGDFDLVLSNPPYIPGPDIAGLMPEVALHEPVRALDGGMDGLDCYRRIIGALPGLLAPAGVAILELGAGQAASVIALASRFRAETRVDLGESRVPSSCAGHPLEKNYLAAGGAEANFAP